MHCNPEGGADGRFRKMMPLRGYRSARVQGVWVPVVWGPVVWVVVFGAMLLLGPLSAVMAESPTAGTADIFKASTSEEARADALRSIPFDRLDPSAHAKAMSVLSHVSVFRRLPVQITDCDPDFYLFLVRHPDLIVNIWELLKISQISLRQTGTNTYQVSDSRGTVGTITYLYQDHDTHVIHAEGAFDGPLFLSPVRGRCIVVLKSGYVRQSNGRYYVASRLDSFIRMDSGGMELLAQTLQGMAGNVADSNFAQTAAFLGSLSRTAEVNHQGVQRLAAKLVHVREDVRRRFAEMARYVATRDEGEPIPSMARRQSAAENPTTAPRQ